MKQPKQWGRGAALTPEGWTEAQGGSHPMGEDMGTSEGPRTGAGGSQPTGTPQPSLTLGIASIPPRLLLQGQPAAVGALPGAGNIWAHSHNRVPPTAAAAGPEPPLQRHCLLCSLLSPY